MNQHPSSGWMDILFCPPPNDICSYDLYLQMCIAATGHRYSAFAATMDERSPHGVVLKKLQLLTERLQLTKEVEPLLQKFKMEKWIALGAKATANELVELALDRIKNQVTDYDVFIRMLKSMPGVEPIAHQMIGTHCYIISVHYCTGLGILA